MEEQVSQLTDRFRSLGCQDPESWARSEVEEGIPQLARFVFLQQLWNLVDAKSERGGLSRFAGPNDDGRGGALRRLKESGINLDDLRTVIREAQILVVREVAGLLDQLVDLGPELQAIHWGLYQLDDNLQPVRAMDGLHESVNDESFR